MKDGARHAPGAESRGSKRSAALSGSAGTSQRKSNVAANPPRNCAATKPGTSAGRMPANVSLRQRARVTAGLAKEVEDVNQYAAVI